MEQNEIGNLSLENLKEAFALMGNDEFAIIQREEFERTREYIWIKTREGMRGAN
jgi:hypothetical protein